MRWISLVITWIALGGCASLPNGRLWGEDATLQPGWERIRGSAASAVRDPWVWGPLVAATAFQVEDLDRRTSDWARGHTPVFGSQHSAQDWSDDLRKASVLAHYVTIAATPGGDVPVDWVMAKARGVLVNVVAVSSTTLITRELKKGIDRDRPNGLAQESFPSGHTSSAAVHTRLASHNLDSIQMNESARRWNDVGLTTLMIGTSWARIEAGWHFPSDTLFSMALGHFMASFVNDAFLGLDEERGSIALVSAPGGAVVRWRFRF